jgi:guanylate kinase
MDMADKYDALVLIGPAGAGKDFLWPHLVTHRPGFKKVVTTTSRARRLEPVEEIEGVDYYFTTNPIFEERMLQNEFLECAVIHSIRGQGIKNTYYGNTLAEYQKIKDQGKMPLYVIDVQGANALAQKLNLFTVMVLPFDPRVVTEIRSYLSILEDRMIRRKNDPADIQRRLASAEVEIPQYTKYSRVLVNAQGMREEAASNLISLCDEAFPHLCHRAA